MYVVLVYCAGRVIIVRLWNVQEVSGVGVERPSAEVCVLAGWS